VHVVGLVCATEHERKLEGAWKILQAVTQHAHRVRIDRSRERARLQRHVLGAHRIDAEVSTVLDACAHNDMEIAAGKMDPLIRLEYPGQRRLRGPAEQTDPEDEQKNHERRHAQPMQPARAMRRLVRARRHPFAGGPRCGAVIDKGRIDQTRINQSRIDQNGRAEKTASHPRGSSAGRPRKASRAHRSAPPRCKASLCPPS
jgi:hypothetical protein